MTAKAVLTLEGNAVGAAPGLIVASRDGRVRNYGYSDFREYLPDENLGLIKDLADGVLAEQGWRMTSPWQEAEGHWTATVERMR